MKCVIWQKIQPLEKIPNNFLKFKGIPVSNSLLEDGSKEMIKEISLELNMKNFY